MHNQQKRFCVFWGMWHDGVVSETTTQHNDIMKNSINRQVLKSCIQDVRSTRADRRIPCLVSHGYTVAVQGRSNSINILNEATGEFNFTGSWNRQTVYYTQQRAEQVLAAIADKTPLKLEIVHRNELRDRTEAEALGLLPIVFKLRNA
jgi:hypothetical protein